MRFQPLGEDDFLLIAAGEFAQGLFNRAAADGKTLHPFGRQLSPRLIVLQPPPTREARQTRKAGIFPERHGKERPLPLSVFRRKRHSVTHRIFRGTNDDGLTPSTRISPAVGCVRPKMAHAISVRPAPTNPASPTISPLRIENEISSKARPLGQSLNFLKHGATRRERFFA